jgi:hypothetical protein
MLPVPVSPRSIVYLKSVSVRTGLSWSLITVRHLPWSAAGAGVRGDAVGFAEAVEVAVACGVAEGAAPVSGLPVGPD